MSSDQLKLQYMSAESKDSVDEGTPLLREVEENDSGMEAVSAKENEPAKPSGPSLSPGTSGPKEGLADTPSRENEGLGDGSGIVDADLEPNEDALASNSEVADVAEIPTGGSGNEQVTAASPESGSEQHDDDNEGMFAQYCGVMGLWRNISRAMSEFKIAVPLAVLLLPFPISCGFVGARYANSCPAKENLPSALMWLGLFPTIAILTRIYIYVNIACSGYRYMSKEQKILIGILDVSSILFFLLEVIEFTTMEASFDRFSHNYCNPKLYNYIYWMNAATFGFMLLTFIIHLPNLPRWLRDCPE